MLIIWLIYPIFSNLITLEIGVIYILCCFRFSVYGLLITGWSSNSSYSIIGSIRSLRQSISYEVRLAIILIIIIFLVERYNIKNFINFQEDLIFIFFIWPLSYVFFFRIMAELNRTPFDFSEGESELISGFNIEYIRRGFILIFLSEYIRIILLSFLFRIIFLGINFFRLIFYIKIMLIIYLVIWIRGTLPRFRYDFLIYLCWLIILPFSLNYIIYILFFKILIFKKIIEFIILFYVFKTYT